MTGKLSVFPPYNPFPVISNMVVRFLRAWLTTPADPLLAEHLSRNKTFEKFVLGVVSLPQKISDYLVPDSEIEELKKKGEKPKLLEWKKGEKK